MTHCHCMSWGVSNAWSHQTQETSQNFSSWVEFFSPFFKLNSARVFTDFKNWNSALSPVLMSLLKPSLSLFDLVTNFYRWHQFYTCITFDPQWYCSSLTLGYFEWCLKHLSAILQLPAHHFILCDAISSPALCNRQHLQGCESLEKNK